jgi:outer membrane lipoprotein-sorting protein
MVMFFTPCLAQEDQVTKIQKAYENIKDIRGNFVQKSSIKDLKRTDTYNGRFFIKPPKMKWEYTGEKPQVIYIKGDEILIYQKKENQIIKSKFDRATYGQAPIALLAGLGDIKREFIVISDSPDRLMIKPRKPMGNIDYIEVTPSDNAFPIKALIIVDSLLNRIEITLKDVKTNTGLKTSLFDFTPPTDATVLEN